MPELQTKMLQRTGFSPKKRNVKLETVTKYAKKKLELSKNDLGFLNSRIMSSLLVDKMPK
jgi:hypothetical protein